MLITLVQRTILSTSYETGQEKFLPRLKGKEKLSQERILRTAVRYADKNGIDGLNIRQLAKLLDAGTMSLYHYFSSKDELLDAMVEFVAGKIYQPSAEESWREAITNVSISAHRVMTKHQWVCSIWSKRNLGPNKLGFMESILRVLREGGFSVVDACDAYHAITVHIEGFALHAAEFPIKPKDIKTAATGFLTSVEAPESIPYFIEHVQHHLDHTDSKNHFVMTLSMILDGFENRLAEKPRKSR